MSEPITRLRITQFLESRSKSDISSQQSTALIVLNSSLGDLGCVRRLYDHATFRVCADGGANRLHDLIIHQTHADALEEGLKSVLPDAIHGDLDSLDADVRKCYEQLGVSVTCDPDQYSTDFGKAIKLVLEKVPQVTDILVLGSLGGRVDQGIGLLHELYREQKSRAERLRFWLFSESSVSALLSPGKTIIQTPLATGLIQKSIGILPLYGPASITTTGLEWDVADWPTQMGGQVSTSNHIVTEEVSVTTDHDVLLTVERATDL